MLEMQTPESVSSLTHQHPSQPINQLPVLSIARDGFGERVCPFFSPLDGAELLARVFRRASLEDSLQSPAPARPSALPGTPFTPRSPVMLTAASAPSVAMSATYLSEDQSDHSLHQQLSALAEAYLQHTGGRLFTVPDWASDGGEYPGVDTPLYPGLDTPLYHDSTSHDRMETPAQKDATQHEWNKSASVKEVGQKLRKALVGITKDRIGAHYGTIADLNQSGPRNHWVKSVSGGKPGMLLRNGPQSRATKRRRVAHTVKSPLFVHTVTADYTLQHLSELRVQLRSAEDRTIAAENKSLALAIQLGMAQEALATISAYTGIKAVYGSPRVSSEIN